MAVFEDIYKALIGGVLDNAEFSLPVAYENDEFDPQDGDPYLAVFLLPAQPVQATLGDSGCDDHTGIFQIDINYNANSGAAVMNRKADEINAVFKSGATFTNDGLNVRINNVGISRRTVSDGQATVNMSIEYFTFSERL